MWHEVRRSERKVNNLMDASCLRAQRCAVFLAKRHGSPHEGLYKATQDQQGLYVIAFPFCKRFLLIALGFFPFLLRLRIRILPYICYFLDISS
ncbi:hypothetical protein KSP39_PZI009590 [Platanthera zijinensis]|uniref:Uncharacterized protein n=1 Tax=Platanthera zijinensis TaxID=2320716 RepID=A0AAP0BK90_9ASPA